MSVNLLLFGAVADKVKQRSLLLDDLAGKTAADALVTIVERFPQLRPYKLHIAIGQEFAEPEMLIADGDELAVFTAVSGG